MLGIGIAMMLSGCSSPDTATTPPPPPETTVIQAENADTCGQFADLINRIPGTLSVEGDARPGWEKLRGEFDMVALSSEGETRDRMAAFVDDWPKMSDLVVYGDVDQINENIGAVERSCLADGNTSMFSTLSKG